MNTRSELQRIEQLDRTSKRHLIGHEGRRTCWREFGAGAPLVLLHGGHGSWLHWVANIDALAASHRVLVPDLPGYGESDGLDTDSDFSGLVSRLAASLDTLLGAGTAFDLAGFSFGGVVAGQLARERPGVRRLALLGAVGHGLRRRQSGVLLAWSGLDDQDAVLARMRHNLGVLMLRGAIDALALEVHYRSCIRTRFQSKKTSLGPTLTQALEQLALPVLMLWGEHDPTGDPGEVGPLWQGAHAGRAYHVLPGAGHWVQYEAADEVNRRLADWFAPERGPA